MHFFGKITYEKVYTQNAKKKKLFPTEFLKCLFMYFETVAYLDISAKLVLMVQPFVIFIFFLFSSDSFVCCYFLYYFQAISFMSRAACTLASSSLASRMQLSCPVLPLASTGEENDLEK
jgi:hypothetical protein